MNDTMILLLILSAALSLLNLLVGLWTWHRYDSLSHRVTRLEVRADGVPTHAQVQQIRDGLANLGGRIEVVVRLMTSIQEHLLEDEP